MIRLLFTVPVSNAKLEIMLSKLKCVKINFCCSLAVKVLENILRIMEEAGSWETFDPMSAIKKWGIDKVRRGTKQKGPRCCKLLNSAEVNVKSLSDDDSYDEELESYLFSSDSKKKKEQFIIMSCSIKRILTF